jgi:hypothetical protein
MCGSRKKEYIRKPAAWWNPMSLMLLVVATTTAILWSVKAEMYK